MISRRRLLFSASVALVAAPAIVRAEILMPVSPKIILPAKKEFILAPIYSHPTSLDVTISPETLQRLAAGEEPYRPKRRDEKVSPPFNSSAWRAVNGWDAATADILHGRVDWSNAA